VIGIAIQEKAPASLELMLVAYRALRQMSTPFVMPLSAGGTDASGAEDQAGTQIAAAGAAQFRSIDR
jgi:hypothetical protein